MAGGSPRRALAPIASCEAGSRAETGGPGSAAVDGFRQLAFHACDALIFSRRNMRRRRFRQGVDPIPRDEIVDRQEFQAAHDREGAVRSRLGHEVAVRRDRDGLPTFPTECRSPTNGRVAGSVFARSPKSRRRSRRGRRSAMRARWRSTKPRWRRARPRSRRRGRSPAASRRNRRPKGRGRPIR
jgi:hypothetical protein